MSKKELSKKDVALLLAENGPFKAFVRDNEIFEWEPATITGVEFGNYTNYPFSTNNDSSLQDVYSFCAIEVDDKEQEKEDDLLIYKNRITDLEETVEALERQLRFKDKINSIKGKECEAFLVTVSSHFVRIRRYVAKINQYGIYLKNSSRFERFRGSNIFYYIDDAFNFAISECKNKMKYHKNCIDFFEKNIEKLLTKDSSLVE